jgi:hypothetical protein
MKKQCPLIKAECLEHGCEFYIHLVGSNPQTGLPTDEWKCAVAWLPILLVENANMTRQATASTDKVASEVRNHHATFFKALSLPRQQRLLDAEQQMKLTHQNGTGE